MNYLECTNQDRLVTALQRGIQCETVSSYELPLEDNTAFQKLHQVLEEYFPLLFKKLEVTEVQYNSLLFFWQGEDSSLEPGLYLAHQDVVPAQEDTLSEWKHAPFSGDVEDNIIWGRGAIDMKGQLFAICEAVQELMEEGFVPERGLYLAFGEDEECGGTGGERIAEYLKRQGVHLAYVLDEGGTIMEDMLGISGKIAAVGVAEKGLADIKVTLKASGGHASMPPAKTALGDLAEVVSRIQKRPMKPVLSPVIRSMLAEAYPHMDKGAMKWAAGHPGLAKPLILKAMCGDAVTNALVRTTLAPTMARGSSVSNVLPESAEVIYNLRLMPENTLEEVFQHIRKAAGDIPVEAELTNTHSSPLRKNSRVDEVFDKYAAIIKAGFRNCPVLPFLLMATTDSKAFEDICEHIYKFQPFDYTGIKGMDLIHSVNERIQIPELVNGTAFFKTCMVEL